MKTWKWMMGVGMAAALAVAAGCFSDATAPDAAAQETTQTVTGPIYCATLYTNASFGPPALDLSVSQLGIGAGTLTGLAIHNNTSSVSVASNCTLELYDAPDRTGTPVTFTGSNPLVPAAFDNKASSWSCRCDVSPHCPLGQHCFPDCVPLSSRCM